MTDTAPDMGEPTTTDTPPADGTPADTVDHAAEAAKWKELARKHEERAKSNAAAARELDELRKQSMTDQEKAVAEARTEARADALREVGGRLVQAEVRAAAAGRPVDVDALLEVLDASIFVGDDGEPDRARITAWVDRVAPAADPNITHGFPDLGQGTRSETPLPLNGDPLLKDLVKKVGSR
jgi:hypothetical protein